MLINSLYERITSLRGTRSHAYLVDMSRSLCSVRLVLHLVRRKLISAPLANRLNPENRPAQQKNADGFGIRQLYNYNNGNDNNYQ